MLGRWDCTQKKLIEILSGCEEHGHKRVKETVLEKRMKTNNLHIGLAHMRQDSPFSQFPVLAALSVCSSLTILGTSYCDKRFSFSMLLSCCQNKSSEKEKTKLFSFVC